MNALIDAAEGRYEEFFGSENNIGKIPENKKEFVKVTMSKISFTMHDPVIRKTRMFLVQEQFRNERIAEVTSKHQLHGIQKMYTRIIEKMMHEGLIKKGDPAMLAVELTAPAVLLIAEADRHPQREDEILDSIEKHIRHFCDVYMKA